MLLDFISDIDLEKSNKFNFNQIGRLLMILGLFTYVFFDEDN